MGLKYQLIISLFFTYTVGDGYSFVDFVRRFDFLSLPSADFR